MPDEITDLAAKVLKAELKNIIKKVQAGKTLTNAERQIINQQQPVWEKLEIKKRTFYKYKKLGMPENLELAKKWIENRQAISSEGGKIIIGGKSFTAADLMDLRGQVMEQQKLNLELKNRLERLNVDEREGKLVDADTMSETLSRILVPLRKALDAMPENIASAVNPDDPARAEEIIRQEHENIFADLVTNMEKNK